MPVGVQHHGPARIAHVAYFVSGRYHRVRKAFGVVGLVARKNAGKIGHVGLGEGVDWGAVYLHHCAIDVELLQANGEELHHFACVVFVGQAAGGEVFFLVAQGV